MKDKIKELIFICLVTITPTLLIWLPFFSKIENFWNIPLGRDGMATVVANYDGPLYIVVAKSLYDNEIIKKITSFPLPVEYYAAHFPLYPLLIRTLATFLGFPYSMLVSTVFSSIFCIYYFYKLAKTEVDNKKAAWLTFVFSIFPARWLITRSIGSPEPLLMGAILASTYYFIRKEYLKSALMGIIAQLTKSVGILLFIAYSITIFIENLKKASRIQKNIRVKLSDILKYSPLCLIPLSLIMVFTIYQIKFNDFFAYFHSGDNIHLFFPPFQVFNYSAAWVGTFWLEEIIFIYLVSAWGVVKLIKGKKIVFASIAGIFLFSILFVSHRDILRYLLPAVPFLFLAYKDTVLKKEFKPIVFLIIIPIYLFSLAFISQNKMPIADWGPLL
jgi:Gpi18-like mannosyltransferase